nr:MAG TPA: hypothetical protein [Caudoviricetes sp.]
MICGQTPQTHPAKSIKKIQPRRTGLSCSLDYDRHIPLRVAGHYLLSYSLNRTT